MADVDDALLEALGEHDPVQRRRRLAALPSTPCAPATLGRVVATLRGATDVGARSAAMEVLAALGDRAAEVLRELLDDPGPGVRRLAVDVVALMSSPRAAELLRHAASDPSTTVRAAALEGVARVGGEMAREVLLGQLGPETPAVVALAALLGVLQLDLQVPTSTLRHWLDEPLTAGASLRVLGRAGEYEPVIAAIGGGPRHRMRSALQGLAEGLERGRMIPVGAFDLAARERILANLTGVDAETAAAAVVVLAAAGDVSGIATALERPDQARLLPSLHRAVALATALGIAVEPLLLRLAVTASPAVGETVRELLDAAQRRSRVPAPVLGTPPVGGLDDATWQDLCGFFADSAGLLFTGEARSRLEARLAPRLEARGVLDHRSYLALLRRDATEAGIAIDAVTVHETYFFREEASLEGLREDIAPTLGMDGRALRVWSAGCSSGEESYTIAAILQELMGAGRITSFDVLGTDISPRSIAQARLGRYGARSFRAPLTPAQTSIFDVDEQGARRPVASLRERVRFEVLNLVDVDAVAGLPDFDLIFCRNVLIYLTPVARRAVLQGFHQRLRPGGALVLGHSESLLHVENPFALWPLKRGLAYRRGA